MEFLHFFRCCKGTKQGNPSKDITILSNFSDEPSNHQNLMKDSTSHKDDYQNHNILVKPSMNVYDNQDKKNSSSKNISICNSNHSQLLNVSIITFSNIKVKESYKTLPEFDTEVMNSHELKLTGELFWGKEIVVDRLGIRINKRKKRDGISYFGISEDQDEHGNPINDFIVNLHKNKNIPSLEHRAIFSIEYDKSGEHFLIICLNEVNILHIINYDLYLPGGFIRKLIIGKINVEILTNENMCSKKDVSEGKNSEVKIYIKVKNKEEWLEYEFTAKDTPITIGRVHSSININNNSISKNHVTIDFSPEQNMFFLKDMNSTNGTFLVLEERDSLQIINEMKFKILETKFTITEIE